MSVSAPAVVRGDGTTTASRVRSRWRRSRGPLLILGLLVIGALLALLPTPRTSNRALAPDNPGATGGRAVAQILQHQGVQVQQVTTRAAAIEAATSGSTLLVIGDANLTQDDVAALAASAADLVLVDLDWSTDQFIPGVQPGWGTSTPSTRTASCAESDASAAGTITARRWLWVDPATAARTCFPDPSDPTSATVAVLDGTRDVTVLADGYPLRNDALVEAGNAAFALRVLGHHDHLVWFVPTAGAPAPAGGLSMWDLMPPWVLAATLQLAVVGLAAAFWRGRRLGPVVSEQLPVVVPSAETTRGRARLYRRSRAYGRAAAALRAGTALRFGARLGLPRSATGPDLADAVARATGRPVEQVSALLYGPPPTNDQGLVNLAHELDRLESEGHRS
ncbi:MAG: DUF4350 domain-containing protein [Actinobacteria bacterium]|nr:DUF4350 domain-containing protein [Actinomycetota bacterium]MCG2800662.1 DUF4350 domain-containing protein [Cellulomonas sp.]